MLFWAVVAQGVTATGWQLIENRLIAARCHDGAATHAGCLWQLIENRLIAARTTCYCPQQEKKVAVD